LIEKLALPNLEVLNSKPQILDWTVRENLGKLPLAGRVAFSGAGSRVIETGVISSAISETVTVYYPFLPGHVYRVTATTTGTAVYTVTIGGVSVSNWSAGDQDNVIKCGSDISGSLTFAATAATGTIEDLIIYGLSGYDFDLAHNS
jgi:hypothetical protein